MRSATDTGTGTEAGTAYQNEEPANVEAPRPVEVDQGLTSSGTAQWQSAATSTQSSQGAHIARRVVAPYPQRPRLRTRGSLIPLQEWEGVVEWVQSEEFGAILVDVGDSSVLEQTVFSRDEVSPDEDELIKPGAVFRWVCARRISETGQRWNEWFLSFRRLPAWTDRELAQADERAVELDRKFKR